MNRTPIAQALTFLLFLCASIPAFSQMKGGPAMSAFAAINKSSFIENRGQLLPLDRNTPLSEVLFSNQSADGNLYITRSGLSYVFYQNKSLPVKAPQPALKQNPLSPFPVKKRPGELTHFNIERIDLNLEYAHIEKDNVEISYSDNAARFNYYLKNFRAENLRLIDTVKIKNIYPGIDWILYKSDGSGKSLVRQDFILHPGADTRNLVFRYSDNSSVKLDPAGNLTVQGKIGRISEAKPFVFDAGTKKEITVSLSRSHNELHYVFPEPVVHSETVIDPDLYWGTALTSDVTGINRNDNAFGNDVETDDQGNIFVQMSVSKGVEFPTKNPGNGAYYKDYPSTTEGAMVIMKFSRGGVLLWSTFFGDATSGTTMAVDPAGNIYAAGFCQPNHSIPLLDNGGYFDPVYEWNFMTKFSNNGQLLWSTNWRGEELVTKQMLCNSKGTLYIAGYCYALELPVKNPGGGAYMSTNNFVDRPFIIEFDPANRLVWATQLYGQEYARMARIAISNQDNLYYMDDSVRMFNTSRQQVWKDATIGWPYLDDIAVDRQENVFVVGYGPGSTGVPITDPGGGAYIDHSGSVGYSSGFIMKYNTAHQIVWSTQFEGADMTFLYRIQADKHCDAVHVLGQMNANPNNFPALNNSCGANAFYFPPAYGQSNSPIFASFKTTGQLIYSSLSNFPYNYYDQNVGFTTDRSGNLIYLFGSIFPYSSIPAVKDPGNGAFIQNSANNLFHSAFLMKLTPSRLVASLTLTNPTGCTCNGSAQVNISCGTPPYSYNWNDGATSASVSGLCSGNHSVTITDFNCNDTTINFSILPAPGSITGMNNVVTNAHCGQTDGKIDILSVTGGVPAYQYAMNSQPFQAGGSFPGLAPGRYQVSVTDNNGCTFKDSVSISNAPGPDSIYTTATAASCGIADGLLKIDSVHGGTAPFQYSFNGSAFSNTIQYPNLLPGIYPVKMLDGAGCPYQRQVTLGSSIPPSRLGFTVSPDHCNLGTGQLLINAVTGGLSPYTYSIDGIQFGNGILFDSLAAGTYAIHVKDNKNCILDSSFTITTQAGPSALALKITDALCDAKSGSMTVTGVTGGNAPYKYSLDSISFASSNNFSSIAPGAYAVYLKDAFGCSLSDSFRVAKTTATSFTIFPKDTVVCYGENIYFSATVNPGPALATYSWNGGEGSNTEFKKNITKSAYVVLVGKNSENCSASDTAWVSVKNCDTAADHCVYFPNAFSPNADGQNDGFGPLVHCPVTEYRLQVFNRWGQLIFEARDPAAKWDGRLSLQEQPVGNYVYICTYTADNIVKQKMGSFILVR